ncbi:PREDICTED: interleukin-13 isoform X2 [Chinchilla lanigera]|uniref:interleukin-13 isoform X2 n=1 Tax=Chinchilla lanigera TaxID=34839 RepID=UPI00038EB916|nr:PREDICTED: interleukin-13 isoform X2 [Chinchilla lanigera]
MAFGVTMVLALACLGGLTAPGPVPSQAVLKELIEELVNVTQDQKTPLCNGSMVWSFNLPATSMWYCAARDSLTNVSSCSALQKTQKILSGLCQHKASARVSSWYSRDTKTEVAEFVKKLLRYVRSVYRTRVY